MTSLYSLRRAGDLSVKVTCEGFRITKFDADYNIESTYELDETGCTCPQGHKATCRHRKMLPLFLDLHHVDDGWFLDWDTRLWRHVFASEAIEVPATSNQPITATEVDTKAKAAADELTERLRAAAFEEENYAPSAPPSVGGSPLRVKRRKV